MYVEVRGARLFFDVEGPEWETQGPELRRKPTLLILHGGPGVDHSAHRDLGGRLSRHLHVIYLDHRGNGRSERGAPKEWTLRNWAADIHGFVEALGLHRPFILGHSFGGYVAQAYAAAYPDQPGGLVLAGTAPRFVLKRSIGAFSRFGGDVAAATASRFFAGPAAHFPEYLERCYPLYGTSPVDPDTLARTIINVDVADHFVGGEMQTFDLRDALPKITAPSLILSAERDVIATPKDCEELENGLRQASRLHFAAAGHEMLRDEPSQAAAAITEFCVAQQGE